jgi:anti-sigma factor RsiW
VKPVSSEELSALLDGELSPERAHEVRAQLGTDMAMTTEFRMLTRLDNRWRDLASAAQFEPQVELPRRHLFSHWSAVVAGALILTGIRLAPKFLASAVTGLALNVIALVLLLGAVFWFVKRDASDLDKSGVARTGTESL